MTINVENFNLPAVEWLLSNLEFHCCEPRDDRDFLENLPPIKFERRSIPPRFIWHMPSTGDLEADFYLGKEMALAYLVLIFQARPSQEYVADPEQRFLSDILDAMENGKASEWQRVGFLGQMEAATDCAFNRPALWEGARKRMARLTDDWLRERCRCILHGGIPPDIFEEVVQ